MKSKTCTALIVLSMQLAVIGPAAAQTAGGTAYTQSVLIPGQSELQTPFLGSVPVGKPTGEVLPLSMQEALDRGLRQNLGLLESKEDIRFERGRRWQELSGILPNVKMKTSANLEKDNLAAKGLVLPGIAIPELIGPYHYYDVRAYLTQPILDLAAIGRTRAATQLLAAAEHSYRNARELVVAAVGNAYLQALGGEARVETAQAQLRSAQTLFDNAVQMHKSGVTAGIDELRAKVELQSRRQQLISAANDFEKQKLTIARIIGLPTAQKFQLTDKAPYSPLAAVSVDQALDQAYRFRQDYKTAVAQMRAAEFSLNAAASKHLPSLAVEANYGGQGTEPGKLEATYTISGILTIPIFEGGSVHGQVLQAEAALRRTRDELADLRDRIEFEIRASILDLKAADEQVRVAKTRVELADLTLEQAGERFSAGVADNLEVVQAQGAVAAAHEAFISSLYAHNLAKLELARAMGVVEKRVKEYLGEK